jgi:hypothetical protein
VKARLRWLWWTIRTWRATRHPATQDNRPGTDDQFGTWPRIRVADLNLQERADRDERGQT